MGVNHRRSAYVFYLKHKMIRFRERFTPMHDFSFSATAERVVGILLALALVATVFA